MMTLRSREKKTACFFFPRDLNMVCPTYWSSMKIKAEKYSFMARMVSARRLSSELKMLMRKWGAKRMTSHIPRV